MEVKKSPKADLEKKKSLFLEIGYIIAIGLALLAFEWTTQPEQKEGFTSEEEEEVEQEQVPVTRQEQKKEPPPPPPESVEEINIVDDDVEIEDELMLEETEADDDTETSYDSFGDEEEEEEDDEGEIFMKVEDMPEFRGGGINGFRNYIQKNLKYPNVAAENGIEGTVFVKFVVDEDGSISNVEVMRGVDPALDEEAVRAIRDAPEWEPGKQRGKPVRVQFTIPIVFKLQ
ncbi:MAG: energy transducer TonB [Bacteroidales bacterium]